MIVAPSGAGKSSLVNALLKDDPALKLSLSTTTRAPRPGEVDGKDYRFATPETFIAERDQGHFLEWAQVHGHFYGTSKPWIESQMLAGNDVMLEIDWQGARQIREIVPGAIWIFVLPPSIQTLEDRLRKRAQDDEATIAKRVAAAKEELSHVLEADYLVINDLFEAALFELRQIISASRLRALPQLERHLNLAQELGVSK